MRARIAAAVLILCCIGYAAAAKPQRVGRALVTFYWTIDESSSRYRGGKSSTPLRDTAGKTIAHTTPRFKRDLVKQGTGILRDGRTVYFVRRMHGESRFRVTDVRYGIGSSGCPLVPYRTIAVDPRFIRHGSRVYIPQLKGAHLPDGMVHDGMFIASDRGNFRGAHVDFFVGTGARDARPFIRKGYGSRSHVTVYVDGRARGCRP